jgi:hypothetical protein
MERLREKHRHTRHLHVQVFTTDETRRLQYATRTCAGFSSQIEGRVRDNAVMSRTHAAI